MMITVLFFAALKEKLQCSSIEITFSTANKVATNNVKIHNIQGVLTELIRLQPHWAEHLQQNTLLFAVNKTMADENTPVNVNDEVAIFPPVTGG